MLVNCVRKNTSTFAMMMYMQAFEYVYANFLFRKLSFILLLK